MTNPFNPSPYNPNAVAFALASNASNVKAQFSNQAYTADQFLEFYPQFVGLLPDPVLSLFITMADKTVQQVRWHENWPFGMANFIAHYATLWLQTTAGCPPTANTVIAGGTAAGLASSKSVGDVSVSYDFGSINESLAGWGDFTLTKYGQQFASMARLYGLAGSYIF